VELANDRLHVGLMTDDPAMLGVGQLGIRLAARDLEAARHWFGHVLGWEVDGAAFRSALRWCSSRKMGTRPRRSRCRYADGRT
jgi:hypothetical protein